MSTKINNKMNPTKRGKVEIIDVWANNLEEQFSYIINLDTEFPGVVAKPTGSFKSSSEYQYHTLRCNVNLLKIIQIGLSFGNEKGETPDGKCCWQFHFKFDLKEDMYAQDSIDLLNGSGINFEEHRDNGIEVRDFAELLTISGFVLTQKVRWISFHSAYDFGYLIKILSAKPLPETEKDFFEMLYAYFPLIYDIKYLVRSCEPLKGGLSRIGEELGCVRIGPAHQAGSDSLLTLDTFFQMMKIFFENKIYEKKYVGILFGLGQGFSKEMDNSKYIQSLSYTPHIKFNTEGKNKNLKEMNSYQQLKSNVNINNEKKQHNNVNPVLNANDRFRNITNTGYLPNQQYPPFSFDQLQ